MKLLLFARELYMYALVGGFVLGLDVFSYWLLINFLGAHYLVAHAISRTLGGLACFILNRTFTFKVRTSGGVVRHFYRFIILYLMSFLLSSALIHFGVAVCAIAEVPSKVTAECIIFIFNYTVMKYWVMAGGGGSHE